MGKLARNKGVLKLAAVVDKAELPWPLVIVGEGPQRPALERELRRHGRDVRFTGWLPRADALRWLGSASLLVFPSHGPESLSRVLLEAGVLGVPVAAMDTGGTRDIIIDEVTGLLSASPDELGGDVARLVADRALADRLAAAGRAHVERTFASASVVERVESLYRRGDRVAEAARLPHADDRAPAARRDPLARRVPAARLRRARAPRPRSGPESHRPRRRRDAGHPPSPCTRRPGSDRALPASCRLVTVPYRTFPLAGRRGTTVLDRSTAYLWFGFRAGRVAARLAAGHGADIVHGLGASALGLRDGQKT